MSEMKTIIAVRFLIFWKRKFKSEKEKLDFYSLNIKKEILYFYSEEDWFYETKKRNSGVYTIQMDSGILTHPLAIENDSHEINKKIPLYDVRGVVAKGIGMLKISPFVSNVGEEIIQTLYFYNG